ncbi:MAG: 4'-phosphopantetheinyl transferase family protein [Bacteroidia bacterium]
MPVISSNSTNWIHVWKLDSNSILIKKKQLETFLSAQEMERSKRFINHEDKMRYLTAHYFLRKVLSKYLKIPAQKINFSLGINNKPYVKFHILPELYFNLSYRDSLFLVGVSNCEIMGVDVEKIYPIDNIKDFCKNYFSKKEQQIIESQKNRNEKLSFLFEFWTMKEAIIKALANGFTKPLTSYDLSGFMISPELIPKFDKGNTWTVSQIKMLPNYKAAFAVRETDIQVGSFDYEDN